MIKKEDVIKFFGKAAKSWDAEMIKDDEIINTILDNSKVGEGCNLLDVACGTGVLIPYYTVRNVGKVTAIDIAPEMAEIAKRKYESRSVCVICGDIETEVFSEKFERIVVYNAFPHFPDPEMLIRRLSSLLCRGGVLTVAHGMSREKIDGFHKGDAFHISNGLMSAEELSGIFEKYLTVTKVISDDKMYQVVGEKI